ncbi:phospholipid/glycerol acyltransferase [Pseudopedobacter saltans DSM 12145]|uniref:Phospholipid/glycerol acyltransferase n=1 Tax=Pseudopedobacter saltans (strain ATCC 51119 / DSM 12145 / JCM 21818 / CCUG 39354 / LMG 10337 / NBRC 100064 / NCIMB 13643) TaxID=762903 RepID=F0S825_PSESL|nr:1-acyl-sn-glycerol-3-phosphate acyltransferase [Pseudopedobacter saltans]ADY51246.1 phospholipid/glycerol acyltransferase [Pseudopedobacter saltans DSM 12145]
MIIKAKPLPPFLVKGAFLFLKLIIKFRFNKLVIKDIEIKPGHSYLLMCNHFSFWDGFLATYLCLNTIYKHNKMKGFYYMSLKKQMQKNPWLRYFGGFSIAPGTPSVNKSLEHAAELLSKPGNVLILFPQGKLESNHVRKIEMQDGISYLLPKVGCKCQLIWTSMLVEFFESLKPSVYFHMLDCGDNNDFDFVAVQSKINSFHESSVYKQFRFTEENA